MNAVRKTVIVHLFLKDEDDPPSVEQLTGAVGLGLSHDGYDGYVEVEGKWLNPFGQAYFCEYCSRVFPRDPENPPQETADNYACPECYEKNKADFPEEGD